MSNLKSTQKHSSLTWILAPWHFKSFNLINRIDKDIQEGEGYTLYTFRLMMQRAKRRQSGDTAQKNARFASKFNKRSLLHAPYFKGIGDPSSRFYLRIKISKIEPPALRLNRLRTPNLNVNLALFCSIHFEFTLDSRNGNIYLSFYALQVCFTN